MMPHLVEGSSSGMQGVQVVGEACLDVVLLAVLQAAQQQ
jgi:hypothetical protein